MPDDLYLIWSEEHGSWWGPNSHGYTRSMAKAGRYTRQRAEAICRNANAGGTFCEAPVRVSLAITHACQMPSGGR